MAAADPLESISIAARTTASQREELVRRISAVERELEEERARGKLGERAKQQRNPAAPVYLGDAIRCRRDRTVRVLSLTRVFVCVCRPRCVWCTLTRPCSA